MFCCLRICGCGKVNVRRFGDLWLWKVGCGFAALWFVEVIFGLRCPAVSIGLVNCYSGMCSFVCHKAMLPLSFSTLFSVNKEFNLACIIFSKILPGTSTNEMGRLFIEFIGVLSFLVINLTVASLSTLGK